MTLNIVTRLLSTSSVLLKLIGIPRKRKNSLKKKGKAVLTTKDNTMLNKETTDFEKICVLRLTGKAA